MDHCQDKVNYALALSRVTSYKTESVLELLTLFEDCLDLPLRTMRHPHEIVRECVRIVRSELYDKFLPEEIEMRNVEELHGKNIVVYDLEIKKRIEECSNGWNSHDEMGISVGVAFDYREMKYRVFMDDNIRELVDRLNEPNTLVVAFNHIGFDNKLLRASKLPLKPDTELRNYDMLLVSKAGCGLGPKDFIGGFKLDHHLAALKLPMKTANGAMAPIWWQQGKMGTVIDYCVNDVTQEKSLFEYMWTHGVAASQYNPKPYKIERPTFKETKNETEQVQTGESTAKTKQPATKEGGQVGASISG